MQLKICKECKKEIQKKHLVRNGGYTGFQNVCRPCKRKQSREYQRKKAKAKGKFSTVSDEFIWEIVSKDDDSKFLGYDTTDCL